MIKILNENKQPPTIYRVICTDCGCTFECEDEDTYFGACGVAYVKCPKCHAPTWVSAKDGIILTDKNIEFPLHFYHYGEAQNAKDIDDQQIQEWVRELICYAQKPENAENNYASRSSGNAIVTLNSYKDEYVVTVAKNYWDCSIPRET